MGLGSPKVGVRFFEGACGIDFAFFWGWVGKVAPEFLEIPKSVYVLKAWSQV